MRPSPKSSEATHPTDERETASLKENPCALDVHDDGSLHHADDDSTPHELLSTMIDDGCVMHLDLLHADEAESRVELGRLELLGEGISAMRSRVRLHESHSPFSVFRLLLEDLAEHT